MKIVKAELLGQLQTYDIGVAGTHNFLLQSGVCSHNCFNRAHSATYSYLTYVCAYLKANYPLEFFCALMSVRSRTLQPKDWAMKAPQYCYEAAKLGLTINPPDINHSGIGFQIRNGEIWFGLNGIRKVGATACKNILAARGQTPFKSVEDFVGRVNMQKVNYQVFDSLIKAGCFQRLGYQQSELAAQAEAMYGYTRELVTFNERVQDAAQRELDRAAAETICLRKDALKKKAKKETLTDEEQQFLTTNEAVRRLVQLKVSEKPVAPTVQRHQRIHLQLKDLLDQGYQIGCYLGQHPASLIQAEGLTPLAELEAGMQYKVGCCVVGVREITTKAKGQKMAFVELDDGTERADLVMFPSQWSRQPVHQGDLVIVKVTCEQTEPIKLKANTVKVYVRSQNNE